MKSRRIISIFHKRSLFIAWAMIACVAWLAQPLRARPQEIDTENPGPGCRIDPLNPSIGTDIPSSYFGPPPVGENPSLIGPLQLLRSGPVDLEAGTITLPLYRGAMRDGRTVWYVLTDTTDRSNAAALGLNFSAKLSYAAVGNAVRTATLMADGLLVFEKGTVDFSPERRLVPGPPERPFPPLVAEPGAIGDEDYSPLVEIVNAGHHIYNAPIIAFDVTAEQIHFPEGNPDYRLVHDHVVRIDTSNPRGATVTLRLIPGFSFARPVLYLSLDAWPRLAAAMEGNTLALGLRDIEVGCDDSAFCAVERLFSFINGPTGCENPQRQGFNSVLLDGRGPFNILGGIPTVANDYSPIWDVNLGEWTQDAIARGYRSRLLEEFQILGFVQRGFVTGPDGGRYGSSGVRVNCPIVFRFL